MKYIPSRACSLCWAVAATACVIDSVPLPDLERDGDNTDPTHQDGAGGGSEDDGATTDNGAPTDASGDSQEAAENRFAATNVFFSAEPLLMVGVPGAAPGSGTVTVSNSSLSDWSGSSAASLADGSFNLQVEGSEGDVLTVEFAPNTVQAETTRTEPLYVSIQTASDITTQQETLNDNREGLNNDSPATLADLPQLSLPGVRLFALEDATVAIIAGPGTIESNLAAVAANIDAGGGAYAAANSDGSFVTSIPGKSGDEIRIFVVKPGGSNAGGAELTATVP